VSSTEIQISGSLKDRLKEKFQAAMADLIPEEVMDQFLEEAWSSFTERKQEKDHHGRLVVFSYLIIIYL